MIRGQGCRTKERGSNLPYSSGICIVIVAPTIIIKFTNTVCGHYLVDELINSVFFLFLQTTSVEIGSNPAE